MNESKELLEVNESQKLETRVAMLKYVIIGDTSVGKSNLLLRYTDDSFNNNLDATLGAEMKKQSFFYQGIKVKEQIWDTAGQEKFFSVSGVYFKGAHGALVVYDISNKESFENLKKWINNLKQHVSEVETEILIVGNKVDLEHKREISYEEAKEFADREGKLI